MTIRPFDPRDLETIKKIHERFQESNFSMPEIAEAYADIVAEENNKVVAYGQIREITESIMLLDLDASDRVKSKALYSLIRESIYRAKLRGYHEVHSFVQDPHFSDVLKKHFGYKDTKGRSLVLGF